MTFGDRRPDRRGHIARHRRRLPLRGEPQFTVPSCRRSRSSPSAARYPAAFGLKFQKQNDFKPGPIAWRSRRTVDPCGHPIGPGAAAHIGRGSRIRTCDLKFPKLSALPGCAIPKDQSRAIGCLDNLRACFALPVAEREPGDPSREGARDRDRTIRARYVLKSAFWTWSPSFKSIWPLSRH